MMLSKIFWDKTDTSENLKQMIQYKRYQLTVDVSRHY